MGDELVRIIKSKKAYFGYDNKAIAKRVGKSERTISRYLDNPLGIPLGTFRILIKLLDINEDEIIRGLTT